MGAYEPYTIGQTITSLAPDTMASYNYLKGQNVYQPGDYKVAHIVSEMYLAVDGQAGVDRLHQLLRCGGPPSQPARLHVEARERHGEGPHDRRPSVVTHRSRIDRCQIARLLAAFAITLLLTACQTTSIQSAWYDTSYKGGPFRKVVVIASDGTTADSRVFEDIFVQKLHAAGVQAVPGLHDSPARCATHRVDVRAGRGGDRRRRRDPRAPVARRHQDAGLDRDDARPDDGSLGRLLRPRLLRRRLLRRRLLRRARGHAVRRRVGRDQRVQRELPRRSCGRRRRRR